jgi:hypothetical protein
VARVYTVTPPENSELNTAVLRQPGLTYQIRIVNGDQESFIDIDTEQQEGWEEISVPLQAYWNRPITIYLGAMVTETATDTAAYWANPRLVVNNP